MKNHLNNLLVLVFILIFAATSNIYSVPLPPADKYDITGIIHEINWYPKKFIRGIPGMSGSAGKDRIMPAHYIIKLINYEGINHDDAIRITKYIKWDAYNEHDQPPFIILKINHRDKNYLKKGMKIKVKGYTVRGDEGGTYTYYENIKILEFSNQDSNL